MQSAADGSFRLPSEVDPWVLVIAHDSGYAEVTADEFAKSSTVRLKPWGRVEGELVVNGKPIADQVIGLSAVHGHQEVNLYYGGEVTTNAAGRFTMERVPPARLFIQPWCKQGKYSHSLDPQGGRMSIAGGQTTRITLPRPGRPIVGRVSLPPDSGLPLADAVVELSISLRPGPFFVVEWAFEEPENQGASQGPSVKPELEQAFQRKKVRANADGTFRIEGLPETEYLLQIYAYRKPAAPGAVPGPELAWATRDVKVPPLADSKEPVDLGNLVLSAVETTPPKPSVAPTPESVRTSGSGKAHTPSGLPSEEAAVPPGGFEIQPIQPGVAEFDRMPWNQCFAGSQAAKDAGVEVPGSVVRLVSWPTAQQRVGKVVQPDSSQGALRAKRESIGWIQKVVDPQWLPDNPEESLGSKLVLLEKAYSGVDTSHVEWEKEGYRFRVSQTCTVFYLDVTPTQGKIAVGDVAAQRNAFRELASKVIQDVTDARSADGTRVAVGGTKPILMRVSFETARMRESTHGIVAQPAALDFKDTLDRRCWDFWWRRMGWCTDGQTLGLFTLKTEGGAWKANYDATGLDRGWFRPPAALLPKPAKGEESKKADSPLAVEGASKS